MRRAVPIAVLLVVAALVCPAVDAEKQEFNDPEHWVKVFEDPVDCA